jgi:hypothetical protein
MVLKYIVVLQSGAVGGVDFWWWFVVAHTLVIGVVQLSGYGGHSTLAP